MSRSCSNNIVFRGHLRQIVDKIIRKNIALIARTLAFKLQEDLSFDKET